MCVLVCCVWALDLGRWEYVEGREKSVGGRSGLGLWEVEVRWNVRGI